MVDGLTESVLRILPEPKRLPPYEWSFHYSSPLNHSIHLVWLCGQLQKTNRKTLKMKPVLNRIRSCATTNERPVSGDRRHRIPIPIHAEVLFCSVLSCTLILLVIVLFCFAFNSVCGSFFFHLFKHRKLIMNDILRSLLKQIQVLDSSSFFFYLLVCFLLTFSAELLPINMLGCSEIKLVL